MGFSRQECWSGLPFPSPGDLRYPGIKPGLLHCRQTLYCLSHQGSLTAGLKEFFSTRWPHCHQRSVTLGTWLLWFMESSLTALKSLWQSQFSLSSWWNRREGAGHNLQRNGTAIGHDKNWLEDLTSVDLEPRYALLSSLVYAEDQSNYKTRSLHHLRRPQAPSRIAKGASP